MNLDTPQKQLLSYAISTPSKVLVNCEINAWMETHIKKLSPLKQNKKYPPKPYKLHTLTNLRKRKEQLMKSYFDENNEKIEDEEKTQPNSGEEKSSIQKSIEWFKKIPIFKVKEFAAEEKPSKRMSLDNTVKGTHLRRSLRKAQKAHRQKLIIKNNSDILQEKMCKREYAGLRRKKQ